MMVYQASVVALMAAIGLASAQAAAQDPSSPHFEVASLKPSQPGERTGSVHPARGGERYLADHASLKMLIITAYRIKADQVLGGPRWIDSDLFDMDAKAEKPSSIEDLHAMLKNLLAERFHLQYHNESKELPVYVLTVDKAAKNLTLHEVQSAGDPTIDRPMEKPLHQKLKMTSVSMDYFAYGLTFLLDRPVINRTGIQGAYDFTLAYTLDLPPGVSENTVVNGSCRPRIFQVA